MEGGFYKRVMRVNWESHKYMAPVYLIIVAVIIGHWFPKWGYFFAGVTAAYVIIMLFRGD